LTVEKVGVMRVYYNENDPKLVAWLQELMANNLIPLGDIDTRSIEDVIPAELTGYTQCHFFAGIGGWPLALQWAGWPAELPVWTGSCPCQPFSTAGRRAGVDDERHLWPMWRWLVDQCRPATIFGEQVESKDGRRWLAGVRHDLERMGYKVGAADLCAAGVGSPQIRQRLWWVADGKQQGPQGRDKSKHMEMHGTKEQTRSAREGGAFGGIPNGDKPARQQDSGSAPQDEEENGRARRHRGQQDGHNGFAGLGEGCFWNAAILHHCKDGYTRRIPAESALFPLAHGIPGRVGLLRGAGNAIVPEVAAEFIRAYMEINQP